MARRIIIDDLDELESLVRENLTIKVRGIKPRNKIFSPQIQFVTEMDVWNMWKTH